MSRMMRKAKTVCLTGLEPFWTPLLNIQNISDIIFQSRKKGRLRFTKGNYKTNNRDSVY